MSNRLFNKYKHDALTPDELRELRLSAESMSDEEIEREFLPVTEHSGMMPSDEEVTRIHADITGRILSANIGKTHSWYRKVSIVAAVMIPLMIAISVFLYVRFDQYRDMVSEAIIVMTGKGEKVTTRLPDGSVVNLNYCSQLEYSPASFNSTSRCIKFDGEGYFDIQTNAGAPFIIKTNSIDVKVLGTKFNLSARNDDAMASLYLESGSVELSSVNQTVMMTPGQLAQIHCATGLIQITDAPDDRSSAWRNGELLFHNKPINQVIATLEACYDYTIYLDADVPDGHFTGCLPANDLNRALCIIETLYDIKADVDSPGHTIRFAN